MILLSYKVFKDVQLKDNSLCEINVENLIEENSLEEVEEKDIEKMLSDAKKEASQITESAYKEKEEILEKTKEQAEQLKNESKQEGYEEGYKKGKEKGELEGEKICKQANDYLKEVFRLRQDIAEKTKPEITKLSVQIAEKIIQQQLTVDQEAILNIVSAALKKFSDQDLVLIRINPKDLNLLKEHKNTFQNYLKDKAEIEVLSDERIKPNNCNIESNYGLIEVNIEEYLEKAETLLKEALETGGENENKLR